MKITKTERLEWLASEAGKTTEELAKVLVEELIKADIIPNTQEAYRTTISSHWADWFGELNIDYICGIFHKAGIARVRFEHIDALMSLRFVGEGDCPICGGTMEVVDFEERCVGGDGYITPLEYKTIWEEKLCPVCGHISGDGPSD